MLNAQQIRRNMMPTLALLLSKITSRQLYPRIRGQTGETDHDDDIFCNFKSQILEFGGGGNCTKDLTVIRFILCIKPKSIFPAEVRRTTEMSALWFLKMIVSSAVNVIRKNAAVRVPGQTLRKQNQAVSMCPAVLDPLKWLILVNFGT